MKTFNEWLNLRESVTFFFPEVESEVDGVEELSYRLNHKILRHFGKEIKSSKMMGYGILQVDGSDWGPQGTINFYTDGLDKAVVEKMVQAIIFYIKEFGVKLERVRKEVSNMFQTPVTRFDVVISKPINNPPELNVSNRNAMELLRVLGIDGDLAGTINVKDLATKLSGISDFSIDMATVAPEYSAPKDKAAFYDAGLSQDQIHRYLDTLNNMAKWGIQNGQEEITYS